MMMMIMVMMMKIITKVMVITIPADIFPIIYIESRTVLDTQ